MLRNLCCHLELKYLRQSSGVLAGSVNRFSNSFRPWIFSNLLWVMIAFASNRRVSLMRSSVARAKAKTSFLHWVGGTDPGRGGKESE